MQQMSLAYARCSMVRIDDDSAAQGLVMQQHEEEVAPEDRDNIVLLMEHAERVLSKVRSAEPRRPRCCGLR